MVFRGNKVIWIIAIWFATLPLSSSISLGLFSGIELTLSRVIGILVITFVTFSLFFINVNRLPVNLFFSVVLFILYMFVHIFFGENWLSDFGVFLRAYGSFILLLFFLCILDEQRLKVVKGILISLGALTAICAFISPFRKDRRMVRDLFESNEFIEVFVDTSLEECERRDPKGMYKKAREGKIKSFTGIDSPYENPENAEIHLVSDDKTPDQLADQVINYLRKNKYILDK